MRKNNKLIFGILFTIGVLFIIPAQAQSVEEGEKLFQQNCTACHQIDKKLVGPALSGVTERRPEEWLLKFIPNSQEVINSGDEYANNLFKEYNGMIMPPVPLEETEVKSILAYIKSQSGEQKTTSTAEVGKPLPQGGPGFSARDIAGDITDDGVFQFLIFLIIVLLIGIFFISIKVLEISLRLNGVKTAVNWGKVNAYLFLAFLILGSIGIIYELFVHGKLLTIGNNAASLHGEEIDHLFWITIVITGIVFIITQVVLFVFVFKYRGSTKRKALYYPENNKLEIFWTAIPALVLTALVLYGFKTWRNIHAPVAKGTPEIEVFAYQFGWYFRYAGPDQKLGKSHFTFISPSNPLGLDPNDPNAKDDLITRELHFVNNEEILLKFRSRDVIHSFWLPHFRVQMYLQPGMHSRFKFTPTITTAEMKERRENPEFEYELACNQICGAAHYNMRASVFVGDKGEVAKWLGKQKSFSTMYKGDSKQSASL